MYERRDVEALGASSVSDSGLPSKMTSKMTRPRMAGASRFLATKFELQRSRHGTSARRRATRRSRQPASGNSGDERGRNSMIRPKSIMRWDIPAFTGVILAVGYVYAQQPAPQTQAPNPYLMGTEGLGQGPRGLTSYMPVASTETF